MVHEKRKAGSRAGKGKGNGKNIKNTKRKA